MRGNRGKNFRHVFIQVPPMITYSIEIEKPPSYMNAVTYNAIIHRKYSQWNAHCPDTHLCNQLHNDSHQMVFTVILMREHMGLKTNRFLVFFNENSICFQLNNCKNWLQKQNKKTNIFYAVCRWIFFSMYHFDWNKCVLKLNQFFAWIRIFIQFYWGRKERL